MEELKLEEAKLVPIKFVYGNTYWELREGEYKLNPGGRPLKHSWVSYFKPEHPDMKVDAFVESITWNLHSTFKNPK